MEGVRRETRGSRDCDLRVPGTGGDDARIVAMQKSMADLDDSVAMAIESSWEQHAEFVSLAANNAGMIELLKLLHPTHW